MAGIFAFPGGTGALDPRASTAPAPAPAAGPPAATRPASTLANMGRPDRRPINIAIGEPNGDAAQDGPASIAELTEPRGSDCAWCRYGKPAAVGAVAGALALSLAGREWSQGALWGALAGAAYGQAFRG